MAHPFLVKDIALRSGTSIATVDRVLNQRGGVHRQTVRKIEQTMHEMEMQSSNVDLIARKFLLDVVMCSGAGSLEGTPCLARTCSHAEAIHLPHTPSRA